MTTKRSWKLHEFVGHSSLITCASLGHKSGRVMATGGEDGKVNMWHIDSPTCIMSLSSLSSAVEVVRFNGTEELICAGSHSGALRIWDLAASKVVRQLTGHKAAVQSLDFHPYGDFIVSGAVDHKVRMWDIRRKGCIFTYKGHEGQVNAVEFSPDGRWISSVSNDKTCKIWNITAGKLLHELKDHNAPLNCLQFHPNEFLLATGSQDRTSIVYDVEKIHVVSRSPVEANPIQHVMFDDSGKFLYTASQDYCKVYSWEPSCVRLDTVLVKWGKPADITISADQLMGCSFYQNIASVHIIDTAQMQKTPGNEAEEEINKEITRLRLPNNQRPSTTQALTRPHSSCGVTSVASSGMPNQIHVNNNNLQLPFKTIDEDDESKIFKPSATLARSPVKTKEDISEKKNVNQNLQNHHRPAANPSNVHGSVSNPELRVTSQKTSPPRESVPLDPVKNNPILNKFVSKNNDCPKTTDIGEPEKQLPPTDTIKNTPASLGGAMNWPEAKESTKRNENIPEKPGICHRNDHLPEPTILSSTIQSTLSLSSVVPNERQDPIGLDMNAFLPAKHNDKSAPVVAMSDFDAIANIQKGFESMRVVLTNRHKNLEIVRALWTSGDVMTSIDAAVKMNDQALIVDLLNVLTLKSSLWNLDLCVVMLPQIKTLIESKYESYSSVGCHSLKLVLKNFAQVIRANLKAPPNAAVDISREERHEKCKKCFAEMKQIRSVLDAKHQVSGKIGSQFRELKILISTIE